MKARVKATDRIIEVMCVMNKKGVAVWEDISGISTNSNQYNSDELEFIDFPEIPIETYTPNYWNHLEHQYAGMAMQGMSEKFFKDYRDYCAGLGEMDIDEAKATIKDFADAMADVCYYFAHALVEKYKKEERK